MLDAPGASWQWYPVTDEVHVVLGACPLLRHILRSTDLANGVVEHVS